MAVDFNVQFAENAYTVQFEETSMELDAQFEPNGGGGGGGGAVNSVNGKTGTVVLDAGDLEYDDEETYAAGSVGAELTALKGDLSDIDDRVTALEQSGGSGLTSDIKQALLQIAAKVAYVDDDGQDYYDDLHDALYTLVSISAVYTQSGTVYTSDSLDSLKSDLVVTALYDDQSTETVTNYTLSGTLTAGTSTITVSYGGKTTTFTVTVTAAKTLSSISAVYTQSGTVYETDSLDSLKTDLVVTAHWSDNTTSTVASADYTLSGTLTVGTSTITVSYDGKTTTFSVTVSATSSYVTDGLIHHFDAINNTANGHDSTSTTWTDLVGTDVLTMNDSTKATWDNDALVLGGTAGQYLIGTDTTEAPASTTVEVVLEADANQSAMVAILMAYSTSACIGAIPVFSDNTFNAKGGSSSTYTHSGSDLTSLYHIAGSYTSNNTINKAYANGSPATTGSATHSLTFSSSVNKRIIGQSNTSSSGQTYPFKGKIYAIRIYNKVLTDAEIAQNYAVDVVRFGLGS